MQMTPDASSGAASQGQPQQPLRVPLLTERLDALSADRREHWLDLGRIQPALVERLAVGPNCLVVADHELPDPELGLPRQLPVGRGAFDVILAWDWVNYLEPAGLRAFGKAVAQHARPGTLLHALIHYRSVDMPQEPLDFRLTVDGHLGHVTGIGRSRAAPRYSPKALEKAMPGWAVDRTLLLNNGMQEFVLVRRSQ